ncbi:MAG: hypothetical protein ACOC0P_06700, partial [Planctomycetota bacterium]
SISLPTFRLDEADQIILASPLTRSQFEPLGRSFAGSSTSIFSATARQGWRESDESSESTRFAAMHFLIFDVARRRGELQDQHLRAGELDALETRLRWATRLKRHLMFAHIEPMLRTLEVHAGRSLEGIGARSANRLYAIGLQSLSHAIDRFDPSGQARFITFLNFNLRRVLASSDLHDLAGAAVARAMRTVRDDGGFEVADPLPFVHPWESALDLPRFLLNRLDRLQAESERSTGMDGAFALEILEQRYAISGTGAPRTVAEIADTVSKSTMLVAATETRAMRRLRGMVPFQQRQRRRKARMRRQQHADDESRVDTDGS